MSFHLSDEDLAELRACTDALTTAYDTGASDDEVDAVCVRLNAHLEHVNRLVAAHQEDPT